MYILNVFEVAELLSQLILKYDTELEKRFILEGLDKKNLSSDQLESLLNICTKPYSEDFSRDILSPRGNIKPGSSKSPRVIYEMKLAVKDGVSFPIADDVLKSLLEYVSLSIKKYRKVRPKYISQRLREFEGQCWLFYYTYYDAANKKAPTKLGQGIIEFGHFGKAKYKSVNYEFVGYYHIYDDETHFLHIKLKLINTYKKNLRILVYCGAAETSLMLGQFYNYETWITAGNVLMELTDIKYDEFCPKHIDKDEHDYQETSYTVREYFSDGHLGGIASPAEIIRESYLKDYLKRNK